MIKNVSAQPPPLQEREGGVICVGGARVQLASVLVAFNQGHGAEEIQRMYPSLELTDIYAVITYYLWHRADWNEYLREHDRQAEEASAEARRRFPTAGIRERLQARRRAAGGTKP